MGMLGATVTRVLAADPALSLRVTTRAGGWPDAPAHWEQATLDAERCSVAELATVLQGADWAINCIGVIKPYIHSDNPRETEAALRINALFPHLLAAAGAQTGCRVLQVATDCVYSGLKGHYLEADPHDAWDAYGKTKSLGEVASPWLRHIRCSIIGPELKGRLSLLEWFLGQAPGARVRGFTNHHWNGVTTLHFARLCRGILAENLDLPQLCHVVPAAPLSKDELLGLMAATYGRGDIAIEPGPGPEPIDRTLATSQDGLNRALWRAAGYAEPPSLATMLHELAEWSRGAGKDHP